MDKSALNSQQSSNCIVKSSEVWKSFVTGDHYTTILKNISVEINKGEFVILFGPSGCGKSTFLNTVMGLEHPDKGDITFMGMKIWTLNSDDRAVMRKNNIGIVYQQQNWLKALDVLHNVALVGSLLGYSKEESLRLAEEKLEMVGMSKRLSYKPYELSSGEQQRINLARSLMSDPKLIIADEPTGNLDIKAGLMVLEILKKLAQNGKTVLMVTHNLESLEFADRILFMLDGSIRKDIKVSKENIAEIKKRIAEDLEVFIDEAQAGQTTAPGDVPKPGIYKEDVAGKKAKFLQILDFIKFNIVFTFSMFLLLLFFVPAYILEKIFFKKSQMSSKVKSFIIKIFNKLEGEKNSVQKSISSWDLGEISLSHLMEKKSRTFITIIGVGIGIGFITFLLSLGYGLESLVVNEMAEIEEMKQVLVDPKISSQVVIDEERYGLIESVDGVEEIYPLINVATTVFYGDSQTDVVSYGVGSDYLEVTRASFLEGENFDETQLEIVVGEGVLTMLGLDAKSLVNQKLTLEFIPVGLEREDVVAGDDIAGAYDDKVEFLVTGVITGSASPVLYFPIKEAQGLGIENYSGALVVITDGADMNAVRRNIETLGMKTSSVMDTVSQVESFFFYFRLALTVIGTVAFLIAVLGMVNTLTVSLLERTREVGLLKSIGMRSGEVRKLFVTESMLIAFSGGVTGVFMGTLGGFLVSLIFSAISVSRGGDYIGISRVPIYLIVVIVFISVLVGFITGLYPSRRAVRMSPLDALRYE